MEFFKDTVDGREISYIIGKRSSVVLAQSPGLTHIFGCPAKQGKRKKYPLPLESWMTDGGSEPPQYTKDFWYSYKVDWSCVDGERITDTDLVKIEVVSSGGLSDATISIMAVHPDKGVVSICFTSYWVEDGHDVPRWEHRLRQQWALTPVEA